MQNLLGQCAMWKTFGKRNADFWIIRAWPLNSMVLIFLKDIPNNNLFEFGYWCSFCSSSVLGQLLWNTISLADFWIVCASLWNRMLQSFKLDIPKKTHSGILCLFVKYLLGSVLFVQLLRNDKIPETSAKERISSFLLVLWLSIYWCIWEE